MTALRAVILREEENKKRQVRGRHTTRHITRKMIQSTIIHMYHGFVCLLLFVSSCFHSFFSIHSTGLHQVQEFRVHHYPSLVLPHSHMELTHFPLSCAHTGGFVVGHWPTSLRVQGNSDPLPFVMCIHWGFVVGNSDPLPFVMLGFVVGHLPASLRMQAIRWGFAVGNSDPLPFVCRSHTEFVVGLTRFPFDGVRWGLTRFPFMGFAGV